MSEYDFKAARQRIMELRVMYYNTRRTRKEDGTWDWWIRSQIKELEKEIAEAHAARREMTAISGSGHMVVKHGNIISPIVPQWRTMGNGGSSI